MSNNNTATMQEHFFLFQGFKKAHWVTESKVLPWCWLYQLSVME
jgi:hypothetical protein